VKPGCGRRRGSGPLTGMDTAAVLAAFDERVRRRPEPDPPDGRVEDDGHVVRMVGAVNTVVWSDLDGTDVDAVIADQVRRFAGRPWEWKHYSYDRPADLPERLLAAGLTRQEAEALLVADVADLDTDVEPPPGVELRAVEDEHDVATFVKVHDEAFGGDHSAMGAVLLATLTQRPDRAAAVIAWAGGTPVSAARVSGQGRGLPLPPGRRPACQPSDPGPSRLHGAGHHDAVHGLIAGSAGPREKSAGSVFAKCPDSPRSDRP
jgi:hypothetical protein